MGEIIGILLFLSIGVGLFAAWIITLVDVLRSEFKSDSDRLIWILLTVLMPFVGAILYWTIGVNQKLPSADNGNDLL